METKQKLGPIQQEWVNALRSGKYKQGRECLHNINDNTWCCLGCATDIAEKHGISVRKNTYGEYVENEVLEINVAEACKFIRNDGKIDGKRLGMFNTLVESNDSGFNFTDIADFVEANPEAVFTGEA